MGQPIIEMSSTGAATAVNTFGPAGLISRRSGSAGTSTFYTFDPQGNVAERLSSAGAVLSSDLYEGYGTGQTTATQAQLASDPFGYGAQYGYYTDRETGLVLCGHRYYDAGYGRWLTRDPAGVAGGVNLYQYAGANPVNHSDPSGFSYWSEEGQVWEGIGEGAEGLLPQNIGASLGNLDAYAEVCGGAAAGNAALNSMKHSYTDLFTSSDPKAAGRSIFTIATTAAGAAAGGTGLIRAFGEAGDAGAVDGAVADAADGSQGCFAAGTLVQMADGSVKPIEEVKPGEWVKSRDPETGKDEAEPVLQTFAHPEAQVLTLALSDGETLTCTQEHRFFVQGKGIEPAEELAEGDTLVLGSPSPSRTATLTTPATVQVTGVLWQPEAASIVGYTEVYNFEVARTHTYFVGKLGGGVWVHNANCVSPDINNLDTHALNSMAKRDWTPQDIMDAYNNGEQFPAEDMTSRLPDGSPSPATRYVNPTTGKSVVINNATGRVIQVGGDGFKW